MEQNRILGKVVGHEFSEAELEMISGGIVVCDGCKRHGMSSTSYTTPDGLPGCQCD